jgi:alpha-L-fucosidase
VIIHFGLYSQLGCVESWALCPEEWCGRDNDNYFDYCNNYRNTSKVLNPVNFNPEKWTTAIKNAGAKYLIFTTKHHDGFCMYDTKFTDFKITAPGLPFAANPKANVAKEVFAACRKSGLEVGAYFSKPDWSTPYFWWTYFPPKDRNPNYDISKYPDRWNRYVQYTQNQLNEITTQLGKVDILWLDGCWVRPKNTIDSAVVEFCQYPHDMDINMKLVAEKARKANPEMLIVDRWVPSEYENYLTPERKAMSKALMTPWESCITMTNDWGWVKNAKYKSSKELIQLLVGIVAKGGNLLLGVGPDGKGEFEPAVYERLADMGKWLDVNGEAIYNTTPVEPYQEAKLAYTSKGENTIYAIYLPDKNEKSIANEIFIKTNLKGHLKVSLLACNKTLKYKQTNKGLKVSFLISDISKTLNSPAIVIKVNKSK